MLKGGIEDGQDSLEKERIETTQDVSSTAQELPHDLIIREEPTEAQETSPILELGEEKEHEQRAELRAARAAPKSQEETPQERSKQPGAADRGLFLPVIVEGELLETSRESTRPAQVSEYFLLFWPFFSELFVDVWC